MDQFEEVFTHQSNSSHGRDRRKLIGRFAESLDDAIENSDGRIRIVATIRADFTHHCLGISPLRNLLQDRQLLLGELVDQPHALRQIVVRPAQAVGAMFETGLVSLIIRDVQGERGALPLLEHALERLWQNRRGPWLTVSAYEASGGVPGAVGHTAQQIYDNLPNEQKPIARRIFIKLSSLGKDTEITRRHIPREELYPAGGSRDAVDNVIDKLSHHDTRLILVDEQTVEVTHEALIQNWPLLQRWLTEDPKSELIYRRLTDATRNWLANNRARAYLY
jgi:hypothetical protein